MARTAAEHVIVRVHVVRWPDEIVEHWDVIQAVPAHPINPNGMF